MQLLVRKTPVNIYISYEDGGFASNLFGEHFRIHINDEHAIIFIDMSGNARVRNKETNQYLDFVELSENYSNLSLLQIHDDRVVKELVRLCNRADHLSVRLHLKVDDSTTLRYAASIDNLEGSHQIDVEHYLHHSS